MPAEEQLAAAARVLVDGAIDRPILATEWRPSSHHEDSRWDAYDLLPGPLATVAALDQERSIEPIAGALTALRSVPADPAAAPAYLAAVPDADTVHFWQALLLPPAEAAGQQPGARSPADW